MNDREILRMLEETKCRARHFELAVCTNSCPRGENLTYWRQPWIQMALGKELASRFINDNVELVVGPHDRRYSPGL